MATHMRRLTLHQLRILQVIAEEGSIRAAADRLHLTSPTVSVQLGQLAEVLGMPLHQVSGRRLSLTEAGQDALEAARRIGDELRLLEQRLAARRGIERGRLAVAAVSTAEYLLPALMGEFREVHPGIEASLMILPRQALLERLRQGLDDVYLMTRPPEAPDLQVEPIGLNPLVMIAAPSHPLAPLGAVTTEQLREARFVVRELASGTRLWTGEWLAQFGVELRAELELGSNEAVKQAVLAGHGVAIISLHAVQAEVAEGRLRLLHVPRPPTPVRWHIVRRGNRPSSPAAEAFCRDLREKMGPLDEHLKRLLREAGLPTEPIG